MIKSPWLSVGDRGKAEVGNSASSGCQASHPICGSRKGKEKVRHAVNLALDPMRFVARLVFLERIRLYISLGLYAGAGSRVMNFGRECSRRTG